MTLQLGLSMRSRPAYGQLPAAIVALTPDAYWPCDEEHIRFRDVITGDPARAFAVPGGSPARYASLAGPYGAYPTSDQAGPIGQTADSDDWTIPAGGSITVSALVRRSTTPSQNGVTALRKLDEWTVGIQGDGTAAALVLQDANPANTHVGRFRQFFNINNRWFHLVAVMSRTALPDLDVAPGGTGSGFAGPSTGSGAVNKATPLQLGWSSAPGSVSPTRSVAHVAFWRRPLTPAERTSLFAASQADSWDSFTF